MTNCCYPKTADQQFNEKAARRDLRRYAKKGPDGTTRQILEAIRAANLDGPSLLDIGAGIGVIQLELLPDEAGRAIHLDAATGYRKVAEREVDQLGASGRVRFVRGDFVELEDELPESDVVTLDRVICCYPGLEALVAGSARKAAKLWVASYPRDRRLARAAVSLLNLYQRSTGSAFRAYVHPPETIGRILSDRGFSRCYKRAGFLWETTAWAKNQAETAAVLR